MSSTPSPSAHDLLVQERLPRWLGDLKPGQIARIQHQENYSNCSWLHAAHPSLQEALRQSQQRNRNLSFALARATADLRNAADFAEPLLIERLHQRYGMRCDDLRKTHFVRFSRDWSWTSMATELTHSIEPLLQAALQNFEKDPELQPETVAIDGPMTTSTINGWTRYHFNRLPFTAAQFAEQCHDLDLGQRYQEHLDSLFGRPLVRSLSICSRREQLQLDLLVARMRGLDDYPPVQRLLDDPATCRPPHCTRLSLFAVDVLDAFLMRSEADAQAVFLYLPGMPQALSRHATLAECQGAVLRLLCEPDLRRRFFGYIQQDHVEHFASVVQRNLTGQILATDRDRPWKAPADTDLHWHESVIEDELFGYLQDRHHRRLLNEARHLAVPSADVDEAARQRRLQYWESLGLDLLGVAAFFIPAASGLMMMVFAAQILREVYEGVEAWEQGDIDGALDHAKAVAVDIGTAVATGVALHYAGKIGTKLIEVVRPDGSTRLWNGDLKPYHVEPPAQARHIEPGLLVAGERHYAPIGEGHVAVQPHADGQRWSIEHPDDPAALRPNLETNGDGAWHGSHEYPLEWSRQALLRRLGAKVADYSDAELELASRISGVDRDALLDVHLTHAPTPPRLLQTLQRLRAGTVADDPLENALEGLYRPQRCGPDSERLALLSLPRQPGWPSECALELRVGDRSGPLRERAGDRFAGDSRLILKVADGYRAVLGEEVQATVSDLFEAIRQVVPELGSDMANLKDRIVEQALAHPGHIRSWVWSAVRESWHDDGRLLGGFDTPPPPPAHYAPRSTVANPLLARYRRLYPRASDAQAREAVQAWNDAGLQPHVELRGLEQQYEYLRTTLGQWADQLPLRAVARDRLLRSWQRNLENPAELDLSAIGLEDHDFDSLPHLGGDFAHVQALNLSANPLRNIPHLLIQQLPPLQTLWASALELRHLPAGLGSQLRILELTDNNITWSSVSQEALAQYPDLDHLNLSGNPLQTPPRLSDAPNLREVSLFDTSLRHMPEDLAGMQHLEHLDLSSNQITRLPVALERTLPPSAQRALSLEHNTLDAETLSRIEAHYNATGIDLMVAEDDYTTLMLNAEPSTLACWERLSRQLPVQYRRDLRSIADEPMYEAAPQTTRRRLWFMLHWLESSPRARASALRFDASKLLRFELSADLQAPEPFATPRLKTEHYLRVAVNSARCQALDEALLARLPQITPQQFEALRVLTLQRLANDPHLRLRISPTASEQLNLESVEAEVLHLSGEWTSAIRSQLRLIDGTTAIGRDAILSEGPDGEPVVAFWSRHLEQRYHAQFEQLQEQANAQLLDAEHTLSEGDYLNEANHLRRQLERERQRLLDDLTRSIAEGTQTHW